MTIHPVILCGGSGTRLWPVSRRDYPKQFTQLAGDRTLFQSCLERFSGVDFSRPIIMTHTDFRFIAAEQAVEVGHDDVSLLLEPQACNTAPAILSAALHLDRTGKGGDLMIVSPSDHLITQPEAFLDAIRIGAGAAREGHLVTFAIDPEWPETGYGYLELETPCNGQTARHPVASFVEKPNEIAVEEMLKTNRFKWNAGIFMFRADRVIAAFEALAPEMLAPCRRALENAKPDLGFLRLDPEAYLGLSDASFDIAIMEKASDVVAVTMQCGWSDLGAWDAVWRTMGPDEDGLAIEGRVTQSGCQDSLLRSESGGPQLVGLGLSGIAVVATRDAVLVADKNDLQSVKAMVAQLKSKGIEQAEAQPRKYCPWGWYETMAQDDRFQVKQIMVPPGRKLSLQSHVHRAEHWIVVKGTARVSIDDEVSLLSENQSVFVPLGAVHRLENPGKVDLHLIEVQTGCYLGEDDIVRYDDAYNRGIPNAVLPQRPVPVSASGKKRA